MEFWELKRAERRTDERAVRQEVGRAALRVDERAGLRADELEERLAVEAVRRRDEKGGSPEGVQGRLERHPWELLRLIS